MRLQWWWCGGKAMDLIFEAAATWFRPSALLAGGVQYVRTTPELSLPVS